MDPLKPYQVLFRCPATGRAWASKRFDTRAEADAYAESRLLAYANQDVFIAAQVRWLDQP